MLATAFVLALGFQTPRSQSFADRYPLVKTDWKAAGVSFEAPTKMKGQSPGNDKMVIAKRSYTLAFHASAPEVFGPDAQLKNPFLTTVNVFRPTSSIPATAASRGEAAKIMFDRMHKVFRDRSTPQLTKTITKITKQSPMDLHSSVGKADYYTAVVEAVSVVNGRKEKASQPLAFIVAVKPKAILFVTVSFNPQWAAAQPRQNGMTPTDYLAASGLIGRRFLQSLRFTK